MPATAVPLRTYGGLAAARGRLPGKVPAMTLLLTTLFVGMASGGETAEEGFNWGPFLAGGISLAVLLAALVALLIFGKGREHS